MARRAVIQIEEEDTDDALLDLIEASKSDPLRFVENIFPWGKEGTILAKEDGPDEWQRELLGKIGESLRSYDMDVAAALRFAVASGHGVGKFLRRNEAVWTPSGPREIGDLQRGDEVLGVDGAACRVTGVYPQGRQKLYRVIFSDGTCVDAGGPHLWEVTTKADRDRGRGARVVTTDEMRDNLHRKYQIPLCAPAQFAARPLAIAPYVVGYLLGNGSTRTPSAVRVACHDPEVYERIAGMLPDGFGLHGTGHDGQYLHISRGRPANQMDGGNAVWRSLEEYGLARVGSADKFVPLDYLLNTAETRVELLRGLMDSDGCISPRAGRECGYRVVFSTSSVKLRDQMVWLVQSLGGVAGWSQDDRHEDPDHQATMPNWQVSINLPSSINPFHLKRKADLYDRWVAGGRKREPMRVVVGVEDVGEDECVCISVDGPRNLYLTKDFIVTHNTTLVAWVILWFISTRPNPQVVVTANTAAQLTSKTWRELAKWHRLALNGAWFQWTATKFYFKADPETWFAQAVPWTKERAEAFAGTHEEHVLIIMDEASAIDDAIYDVAEGAMTTKGAMWMAFGNPTRNTGRFRECWRKFRHRWITMQVDSRKAKKANQAQINAWIEDYGEDSDFVRIRVRGEFPRASSSQFIGSDIVEAAQARWGRALREKRARLGEVADQGLRVRLTIEEDAQHHAPKIMSLDVARFGDDESVVGVRQGQMFVVKDRWREKDLMQTVSHMARLIDEEDPDAVFIDAVGLGAGVVDRLRQLGYEVEEVNGALKALEENKYFNRRMEMWDQMRTWLRNGGMIDADDTGFADDLTGPEFGFDAKDRWQLESKDDMKARGLPSPDVGDALSMTFFMPVSPRRREGAVAQFLMRQAKAAGATTHMSY